MLFNSLVFLLFGAIFYLVWPIMRSQRHLRWIFLTGASFVFYGWWDWRFLFLILASGLLDFFVGMGIPRFPRYRKGLLVLSILGNVGSLCTFKYLTFATENVNHLLEMMGLSHQIPLVQLTLPVGISFYTFQSMSYTIDIYRRRLEPTHNVFHFFAYLSMFPQLVAGPIIRASELLPQLLEGKPTTEGQRWDGLKLITHGYFKKVVIADNLAPVVNMAFGASVLEPSAAYWWVVVSMFGFQVYCDFSGYSDIARGLAKWMGYDFPLNFNHPYVATSIREYWSRWHISLSTWFRDYVYIPLGGSKRGVFLGYWNLWITMVISGVWHGAAWTFGVWGALHGLYMTVERSTGWPQKLKKLPGGRYLAWVLLLIQIWVGYVIFRAESLGQAVNILKIMFDFSAINLTSAYGIGRIPMAFLLVGMMREVYFFFRLDQSALMRSRGHRFAEPVILSCMIAACVFLRGPGSAFIYFQF